MTLRYFYFFEFDILCKKKLYNINYLVAVFLMTNHLICFNSHGIKGRTKLAPPAGVS